MFVENNQIRKGEYFFLIILFLKKDGVRMKWIKFLVMLEFYDFE